MSQDGNRSAVEVAMEKASKQAAKTTKCLLEHPEPRDRTLSTIRSPSYDAPGASTLPVVEEIGEGSSTGGKNSPSSGKSVGLEDRRFHSLPAPSRPPPPPPPTRSAPLPPTADGNTSNPVANERPLFQRPKGPATPSSSRTSLSQSKSPNHYVAST
jgi:1-phosphatidylinositol-4-phosphate 5-kinase